MTQRWVDWARLWFQPAAKDDPQPAKNDFHKFCQGIVDKLDDLMKNSRSSQEYLMNEKQCLFLVKRLSKTRAGIPLSSHPDEKTSRVFQELRYVFIDADRLIQSCCIKSTASNSERLRAAIEQGDMKHIFAKLLYDVKWHTYVLRSILDDSGDPSTTFEAARCIGDLSGKDNTALMNAKKEDDNVLTERLRSLKLDREPERELADQLLKHRDVQAQSNKDSEHGVLLLCPEEMKEHLDGQRIGKGSYGEVRETNILGGRFAVKIISQSHAVEMKAMQGLGHHPNIVPLYCSSRIKEQCFLIMERMEDDLARILEDKQRKGIEVSLVEKVVMMLEIAEGMRYIHRMHMAHRDLKPQNVLVNLEKLKKESSRAYSVKIADFGLTKTEDASRTYKDQTTNTGSLKYMAPEVIAFVSNERGEFNPTKADVYSFGIMSFEILTGRDAFGKIERCGDFKKEVKGNGDFRPDLQQGDGPPRLKSLIRRCWAPNHRCRPDFHRICQELRYTKGLLLRGDHEKLQTTINFTGEPGSPDMTEQEYPNEEKRLIGASRKLLRIAQSLMVKAIPPLSIRPDSNRDIMTGLDNIMHCVPALKGERVSTKLTRMTTFTNTNGGDLDNHIKETNFMFKQVVKCLTDRLKVEYKTRRHNLQKKWTLFLRGRPGLGIPSMIADVLVWPVALGAAFVGALIFTNQRTIIDGYELVLESAILESSEWSEASTERLNYDDGANSANRLEMVLYKIVKGSSQKFQDLVNGAHSMESKDVPDFKSENFQMATAESRLKLLKRIKIVYDTISLYNKVVTGVHYIGIFGAEDAGKSTFIKRVLRKSGPSGARLPETGIRTHTKVAAPYMVKNSLWLVDFPGGDGVEHYADMWKQFSALSTSAILFLDFKCDIKKPQVKMYKELKENLGAETEVIVVFNKVDLMVQHDNIQEFTSYYFKDQIEKSHTKLNCKKDAIHFSCVNPICPDTLEELKKVGVLGFEELMEVVHPLVLK